MSWKISKEFNLSYGHRVYSQILDKEYSLDSKCACRHMHGHNAKVIVHLESDSLNEQGMVTDFKHLQWFKKFLDDVIDHKFIIDKNDPLFNVLFFEFNERTKDNFGTKTISFDDKYSIPDITNLKNAPDHIKEYYESFVIVNFVPTSENLSKWLFDIVKEKMSKINVKTSKLEFYETPKSKSEYY